MKKPLAALLFALVFLVPLSAQVQPQGNRMDPTKLPKIGSISGILVDSETEEPIPYAAVKVVHKMSEELVTGGMTNEKGQFRVEQITLGPNVVEFASVGYKTSSQEVRLGGENMALQMGKIKLVASSSQLDEVIVQAERQFMTNEIDRKVYDPSKLILSKTGSATDVLENIPSVELDMDGNITLRGSSAVRIMIDGRPSRFTGEDLTALLQALPGGSVERVEVMTNPSAKYDPDGTAGMINIVLKKSALQGLNGSVNASYSGADRVRAGLNLNYKVDQINLFLNAGHSSGLYPRSSWSHREVYSDTDTLISDQINTSKGGRNGNNVKLGFDWTPNDKHTLTLQGTYNQNTRPNVGTNIIDWQTAPLDYTISQFTDRFALGNNLSSDFLYDYKPKKGEEFNLRLSYTESNREDELGFSQDTLLLGDVKSPSLIYTTLSNNEQWEFNARGDYTKKWDKSRKLEAGFSAILRDDLDGFTRTNTNITTGEQLLDTLSINNFLYSEYIYGAYTNYGFKKGPWGFQLGLRAEQAYITANQLTQDSIFTNNYFQLYPSTFVTYEIARGRELNASYSRRVSRPGGRQLNPFIDYSDPFNLRAGNPYLLPEFTDSYELGYTHILKQGITFNTNLFFRDKHNLITWFSTVTDEGINLTTHENLNNGEDVGLDFSFRGKLGSKGAFVNLGGNFFYSQVSGEIGGDGWVNSGSGYGLNTMISTPLWKNGSLQLMGNYRSKRVMAQGIGRPFYFVGGGFKQSFMSDRLNLSINTRDLFNTMAWNYESYGVNFFTEGQFRWRQRTIEIGLTYNFGEVQRRRRQMDRNSGGGDDMDGGMF